MMSPAWKASEMRKSWISFKGATMVAVVVGEGEKRVLGKSTWGVGDRRRSHYSKASTLHEYTNMEYLGIYLGIALRDII